MFHNLCSAPQHPDLIVKYQEEKDIGFGKVSFSPSTQEDVSDLCHCTIWTKRALDELVTKLEGVKELILLFF